MNKKTERVPQGRGRCLLWDTISEYAWTDWEKLQQVSVTFVGVRSKYSSRDIWNQNST